METKEIPRNWGCNGIALHDESMDFMQKWSQSSKSSETLQGSVEEERQAFAKFNELYLQQPEYDGTLQDTTVPSAQVEGGIPVRIYKPSNVVEDPAIIVFLHGGGHFFGSIETVDAACKQLSRKCGCLIVSVEYRLCPEHEILVGLEDCVTATEWVSQNKATVGGSTRSAVGVSGDSAGGHCAAYVSHRLPDLDFQILVYPWVDKALASPSIEEYAAGPFIEKAGLQWVVPKILKADDSATDPRWSAIYREDFCAQPPTLVILAQLDCIRDDGRRYAKKLIDAGVFVMVYEIPGATHGFFTMPTIFKRLADQAYTQVNTFLGMTGLHKA